MLGLKLHQSDIGKHMIDVPGGVCARTLRWGEFWSCVLYIIPHPNHELKATMAPNHNVEEEKSYAMADVAVSMIFRQSLRTLFKHATNCQFRRLRALPSRDFIWGCALKGQNVCAQIVWSRGRVLNSNLTALASA
jgi:hypothetical protein